MLIKNHEMQTGDGGVPIPLNRVAGRATYGQVGSGTSRLPELLTVGETGGTQVKWVIGTQIGRKGITRAVRN